MLVALLLASATPAIADNYGSQDACNAYTNPVAGLSGEDTIYSGEKIGNGELNLLITPTQIIGYEWSCERVIPNSLGRVDILCAGKGDDLDPTPYSANIALRNDTLTFIWRQQTFVLHRCEVSQLVPKPFPPPVTAGPCR
jgi:hypothetical protein